MIKATLQISGRHFSAEGKTLVQVFGNLKPTLWRGRGVLQVTRGDIVREKILMPAMIARFFGPGSPTSKQIAKKQLLTLFDKKEFERS